MDALIDAMEAGDEPAIADLVEEHLATVHGTLPPKEDR